MEDKNMYLTILKGLKLFHNLQVSTKKNDQASYFLIHFYKRPDMMNDDVTSSKKF